MSFCAHHKKKKSMPGSMDSMVCQFFWRLLVIARLFLYSINILLFSVKFTTYQEFFGCRLLKTFHYEAKKA